MDESTAPISVDTQHYKVSLIYLHPTLGVTGELRKNALHARISIRICFGYFFLLEDGQALRQNENKRILR
jgi:hypothetical protein